MTIVDIAVNLGIQLRQAIEVRDQAMTFHQPRKDCVVAMTSMSQCSGLEIEDLFSEVQFELDLELGWQPPVVINAEVA